MKVLVIGPFPPPYGGMAIQIQRWQRYLAGHYGCQCVVLNIGESRREHFEGCESVHGYIDFVQKLCAYGRRGYLFHLVTTGHSFKSWLSSLVCVLASVTNGFKSVLVFGSGDAPLYLKEANIFILAIVKLTTRLSGQIVCRNKEMHDTLINIGVRPVKLSILSGFLGVDASAPDLPLPNDIRQFIETHSPLIGVTVYVPNTGELYPEYGLNLIGAAIRSLKEEYPTIGVIIMGPGHDAGVQIAGAEECSEHLCFTGPLSHDHVINVMRKLTVFARPTYTDGDSISIREALALKIPVVASDTSFRPEGVLRFAKGDCDDLLGKLRQILEGRIALPDESRIGDGNENARQLFGLYEKLNGSPKTVASRQVATKGVD